MRVGDAQLRDWHLGGVGARDEVADDVIGFDRQAGLDVTEHRGRHRRALGGEVALHALEERPARRVARRGGDRAGLVQHAEQEIPAAGSGEDVADRGAHQAGGRRQRGEKHPLLPHVLHDVLAGGGPSDAALEGLVDRLDPIRQLAIALAVIDRLHRLELHHLALLIERCGDGAEATEHALLAELVVEDVEMLHAVEHRDDRGIRPDCCRERLDGVVEVEGLAAEQHDVELVLDRVGLNGRRIFQGHVAVRALDDEAGARELAGASWPDQEGDVATGLQQPATKIAADGASADHEDTHGIVLVVVSFSSSWRKPGPITPTASCRTSRSPSLSPNAIRWLWVLAFARTTSEMMARSVPNTKITSPTPSPRPRATAPFRRTSRCRRRRSASQTRRARQPPRYS